MNAPPLDAAGFAAATGVSRETLLRLEAFAALLRRWADRINLVAPTTLPDLWRRHLLDSAQLLPLVPPQARSLIDLGSGAGFPGLVLAILGAAGVELVEADARKCAFLREAARLAAAPVIIHNTRIEALPARIYDVVTARACASLEQLLALSQRFTGTETVCLFAKGKQAGHEVSAAQKTWSMDVVSHRSRTDPHGVILCLKRAHRR